ncbi:MAG: serine/threonine-protein phosphatase [Mariniblastus sp.]|nr:serine/threonine-protein phosphatase [Mariniblastus sp.]
MQPKELSCMQVWGGNQPTLSTFEKAGADIWLYSRPYDQSHGGGDTYYLSSCASGRITRMLLADISGHGQSASAVAISLRDLMRKHINQIFPNKLFEKINGEFTIDQSNDRFATAILHSYFAPTRKLRICNAGHPPPFVYRQNTKQWTKVELPTQAKLQDLPFGITENSDYQEFEIDFTKGDLLFSYTDGLADLNTVDGNSLGIAGIQTLLKTADAEHPQTILDLIVETIEQSEKQHEVIDDISLLLVRANTKAITLRDNLLAPFRWLGTYLNKES